MTLVALVSLSMSISWASAAPVLPDYRIGAGDVLSVEITGEDFGGSFVVGSNGEMAPRPPTGADRRAEAAFRRLADDSAGGQAPAIGAIRIGIVRLCSRQNASARAMARCAAGAAVKSASYFHSTLRTS